MTDRSSTGEEEIVSTLAERYPLFARSTIERWVDAEIDRYSPAAVRTYVPVLVQRGVEARLRALSDESQPQSAAAMIPALEPAGPAGEG